MSNRLSNSVVSLLNYQGTTLKTYRIGYARDTNVFDVNFAGESGVLITNPLTISYLGCYTDNYPHRTLPHLAGKPVMNGRVECVDLCLNAGYKFAGTQCSDECWCGNSNGGQAVPDNECNKPCTGNAAKMCGGAYRNSVFQTTSYLGCYADLDPHRNLPHLAGYPNINGGVECVRRCLIAGYIFAGTQFPSECWCGNSYGHQAVHANECNKPCTGNTGEMCGGAKLNSVYRTVDFCDLAICNDGNMKTLDVCFPSAYGDFSVGCNFIGECHTRL